LLVEHEPDYLDDIKEHGVFLAEDFDDTLDTALRADGLTLELIHPPTNEEPARHAISVRPATFIKWADSKGYAIPSELQPLLDSNHSGEEANPKEGIPISAGGGTKPEQRATILKDMASTLFDDPLSIPEGGKRQ
jgi:hypothetical protein